MLQEIMACRLNLELGTYFQYVGSMHIYEDKCEAVRNYIDEGHHRIEEMPKMPTGDPTCAIQTILDAEAEIRHGNEIEPTTVTQDDYWVDLIRLLQLFWAFRRDEPAEAIVAAFHHPVYRTLLGERLVHQQPRSLNSQRNNTPLRS